MKIEDIRQSYEDVFVSLIETKELPKYSIYIPSKGRADRDITTKFLREDGIPFYLVVEPQDYEAYVAMHGSASVLKMDKNDQGIAYARNWCKTHSISQGHKAHWQIDDNIYYVGYRHENKNRKHSPRSILSFVELFTDSFENFGAASLAHIMFAFAKRNKLDINKQVYSCALFVNMPDIQWRHDCIEDTDYSLQLLSRNYVTFLFNHLIMNKVATGVIKGGNTEISHGGNRRLLRSQRLAEYWPGWFKVTEQYGRVKIAPSRIWRTFKQEPRLPKEIEHNLYSFNG